MFIALYNVYVALLDVLSPLRGGSADILLSFFSANGAAIAESSVIIIHTLQGRKRVGVFATECPQSRSERLTSAPQES